MKNFTSQLYVIVCLCFFLNKTITCLNYFPPTGNLQGVIPAKAGIHVFHGLKWTPAFAGVTVIRAIIDFEIGSNLFIGQAAYYGK